MSGMDETTQPDRGGSKGEEEAWSSSGSRSTRPPLLTRESSAEWPDPLPQEAYSTTHHFLPHVDELRDGEEDELFYEEQEEAPQEAEEGGDDSHRVANATDNRTLTDATLPPSDKNGKHHYRPRGLSFEILTPHHDSPLRKSNLPVATFNLVATIVGGGVLSLPLAFQKTGIVLGTVMMIFAAIITDFSLYILCSCGRRTGASSYAEVCLLTYGPALELFTTLLLFTFLLFVIVAYMVLVRDIWTPIFMLLYQWITRGNVHDGADVTRAVARGQRAVAAYDEFHGDAVFLGILLLISPFLLQKSLHSLRYNCYVGFASISILCCAIVYRVWEKYSTIPYHDEATVDMTSQENAATTKGIMLITSSFADALYAFPIITLSFLSSFNVLSVHGALVNPTRKRVRYVIDGAVLSCFVLMYAFGLAGYLYAVDATEGNILLNFDSRDKVILVGRMGCGITIMLGMAMIVLPCRESAWAIGPKFADWKRSTKRPKEDLPSIHEDVPAVATLGEETPLISKEIKAPELSGSGDGDIVVPHGMHDNLLHIGSTFAIVLVCYVGAVAAPGVAIVWSICGSSMAFIIAFILPAACYIKVRAERKGHWNRRVLASWLLLVFSVVGAVACTVQTAMRIFGTVGKVNNAR